MLGLLLGRFKAGLELILIRAIYGCFYKLGRGVVVLGVLIRRTHYVGSILGSPIFRETPV